VDPAAADIAQSGVRSWVKLTREHDVFVASNGMAA
jgi:hypothetical protein